MDYIKLTNEINERAKKSVKKSRYEHSVRVAEMCARLCRTFNLNDEKGYLAGIGHDMCKDLPDEQMIEIASRDGFPLLKMELKKPALLHGRAAAVVMKEEYGIKDEDILEAVAYHTSGKPGMCDLTKCLYIADKIEVGRPQVNEKYLERLFALSLDEMFYTVFTESIEYMKQNKKDYVPFPGTDELLAYYKPEKN